MTDISIQWRTLKGQEFGICHPIGNKREVQGSLREQQIWIILALQKVCCLCQSLDCYFEILKAHLHWKKSHNRWEKDLLLWVAEMIHPEIALDCENYTATCSLSANQYRSVKSHEHHTIMPYWSEMGHVHRGFSEVLTDVPVYMYLQWGGSRGEMGTHPSSCKKTF